MLGEVANNRYSKYSNFSTQISTVKQVSIFRPIPIEKYKQKEYRRLSMFRLGTLLGSLLTPLYYRDDRLKCLGNPKLPPCKLPPIVPIG